MEFGTGSSFVAVAVALLIQIAIVVGVLALLRPLILWMFGINELLAELRALRNSVASLPRPQTQAPAPRESQATGAGWKGAEQAAQSAAQKMRYVD